HDRRRLAGVRNRDHRRSHYPGHGRQYLSLWDLRPYFESYQTRCQHRRGSLIMHHDDSSPINQSRRSFLKYSGGLAAGLAIGFHWPQAMAAGKKGATQAPQGEFEPNAWVRVLPDNSIKIVIEKYDSGTGTHTALAACVCEELDADPMQVDVSFPQQAFLKSYLHPLWKVWSTGGSTSIRLNYERMRNAGAIARTMLVAAAAEQWGVKADSCHTEQRRIVHAASGRSLR